MDPVDPYPDPDPQHWFQRTEASRGGTVPVKRPTVYHIPNLFLAQHQAWYGASHIFIARRQIYVQHERLFDFKRCLILTQPEDFPQQTDCLK